MVLRVKKEDVELMFEKSREAAPAEACGILVGKKSCGEKKVEEVVFTKNVLSSPTRYKIDPENIFRAFQQADGAGQEVVGIFHSHPIHGPFWSATDEKESKFLVGYSFLILSLKTNGYRSYSKVQEEGVEEEQVIAE